jgi:hypothetical protein
MVRTMRASGVDESLTAKLQLGVDEVDDNARQRLDRAEATLPRPQRDSKARQRQGYALGKMRKTGAAAIAAGRDPESDPATLRASIGWLRAHAEVLRAEPDAAEFRQWLPEHFRDDPFREIDREVARIESTLAELTARRERADERERAAARRDLAPMRTSDYARLSKSEQEAWLARLGLEMPDAERPAKSDQLSRLPLPLSGI